MRFPAALVALSMLSAPPRAQSAEFSEPTRVWAFIVGVLEWKDKAYESFPKKGRRDAELADLLRRKLGVPEDHIMYLQDSAAGKRAIESSFARFVSRAKPGDLLLVYYAGHGDREPPGVTYFVPYDAKNSDTPGTGWAIPAVFGAIERGFKGSRVLLTADCCYSGGLTEEAAKRKGRISYATLTSSRSSSESTGRWTFTEALLRGLGGSARADLDGDGQVTFAELARHIEFEMASVDEQLSSSAAAGDWRSGTRLAAVSRSSEEEPAERPKPFIPAPSRPSGAPVEVEWNGKWYPARIRGYKLGVHLIHYDGFEAYWDEWVSSGRIRERAPAP